MFYEVCTLQLSHVEDLVLLCFEVTKPEAVLKHAADVCMLQLSIQKDLIHFHVKVPPPLNFSFTDLSEQLLQPLGAHSEDSAMF